MVEFSHESALHGIRIIFHFGHFCVWKGCNFYVKVLFAGFAKYSILNIYISVFTKGEMFDKIVIEGASTSELTDVESVMGRKYHKSAKQHPQFWKQNL